MIWRPGHSNLVIALAVAAVTFPIVVTARRLHDSGSARAAAETSLDDAARDMAEITRLRAMRQIVEARQRPAQDVIAQVNAALADVGIPAGHFESLTPETEGVAAAGTEGGRSLGDGRLLQQSLRLTLKDLSPAQIGAFLLQWREAQPMWTPTRIELVHSRAAGQQRDRSRNEADANRYDATIQLTALYLDDALPAPSTAAPTRVSLRSRSQERP